MQEVSRVRSTHGNRNPKLAEPVRKGQIQRKKLHPHYVVGFIDGEGSFSVSVNKHRTMKSGIEVKPEFEIELRADDREILERVMETIGCGILYDCSYERYGWFPHVKYKITSTKDMEKYLFPFLDRYPLQAKKRQVYKLFRTIILLMRSGEHRTERGISQILELRNEMRKLGKKHNYNSTLDPSLETARIRENRSSGGVEQ